MKLTYSNHFKKRLKKNLSKNPKLLAKVSKQLKLLRQDIAYPSLKTHKLQGKRTDEYAIWIAGDIRITFVVRESLYLLTDILTHDEY